MAILVECPACRYKNSLKKDTCKCGFALRKAAGKAYWIEYYDDGGLRKRQRIGPSKGAAEQRLRDVLKARTEGRHIQKDLNAAVSVNELGEWYRALPDVQAKRTFRKELSSIKALERLLGKNTKIKDLTPGRMEVYRSTRLSEASPRHPGKQVRPSTVNREIACLNGMINRAVRHEKLISNPMANLKKLPENNVRMKILTAEEFLALVEACPVYLKPIVTLAFHTGMRKSEIAFLTWGEVDLAKGFIRLSEDRTKTKVGRSIPLPPEVKTIMEKLPRAIHTQRVFLRNGKPFDDFKKAYQTACKNAGLQDFTFHDLRHCALNNLRLAGNDYIKIMAVSGHKTMATFKRYNLVTEDELSKIQWPDGTTATGD